MKLPVALFKKKARKLCLFLKAKSQNLINTVVRCLHKEKDVKKICKKRKICKVGVFLICFISYLSFKNNTSLS